MTNEEREKQDQFWPGFTVQCDKCGSHDIRLENTIWYSSMSGMWGNITLVCDGCEEETNLTVDL